MSDKLHQDSENNMYQISTVEEQSYFIELVKETWRNKKVVFLIIFLSSIISLIIALLIPNKYQSNALLAINADNSNGGLSSLAGQFGGIASLAGINLGGSNADQATIALKTLSSRKFINQFIAKHDLLITLMAVKKWDDVGNKLILDESVYNHKNKKWITRKGFFLAKKKPTVLEAYESFIKNNLAVKHDKKDNLVRISMKHYSPEIAKKWLDWLILDFNEYMKQKDSEEAKNSIKYLKEQINKTAVTDMKSVFFKLIEEQSKTIMLAEVRDEYAFKTIDPPMVPELKAEPKRSVIVLLGFFFGILFVSIFSVIKLTFGKKG